MLVINICQIISFSENFEVKADQPPPPDDNVNGSYTQYIQGDWIVNETVSLNDEIIILSGNLTILSGGSLNLGNVTLAINNTPGGQQFEIEVYEGGSLNIFDGDNNPATTHDSSNITDSPFDIDNGTVSDPGYMMRINSGANLSIRNSIIHECGYYGIWGLNIMTDENVTIENSTFLDKRGVNYQGGGNITIKNCNFSSSKGAISIRGLVNSFNIIDNNISYSDLGLYVYNTKNGIISGNEIHHCDEAVFISGDNFIINDNLIHNNTAIYFMGSNQIAVDLQVTNSEFYNNTIVDNGNFIPFSTNNYGLQLYKCDNLQVYNNIIENTKNDTGIYISSCSNLFFNNNTVINNYKYGIYCGLTSDYSDLHFYNNNISENNKLLITGMSGLRISDTSLLENYVEVKNNIIYGNDIYGISLYGLEHYSISGNDISNSSMYGVYVQNVKPGDFSNNSIQGDQLDFYVLDGEFEVTNCTFNDSKIFIVSLTASIMVQNFLHVNVTDINGPVPGIDVFAKNNTGIDTYCGKTDKEGLLNYIKIINMTIKKTVVIYHDPYNISAELYGNTSYGDIEPTMNRTNSVNIYFNMDLSPQAPSNLQAVSNVTNVDLSWTSSNSPDLHHYLIYRRGSSAPWMQVYNSSLLPLPERLCNNWTDLQAASDWNTYHYKVFAVDSIDQNSNSSNIVSCGDWVVNDTRSYSDISVMLNGSLIVFPTGNLTLRNATILFNNSFKGEYGIEVMPGGTLFVLDNDEDHLTEYDQSNITTIDIDNNLYFIIRDSKMTMRNSKLSNCGSNQDLDSPPWELIDAIRIISYGEPWTRGMYITGEGSNVTIENNNMTGNFVSILIDNATGTNVVGNVFSDNIFDIYLNNSELNLLKGNSFENNHGFPIFLFSSGNNTISSNNISNPYDNIIAGIYLYTRQCYGNNIINNNISGGDYGINLNRAGDYNNISHNFLSGQMVGIHLSYTYLTAIMENSYNDSDSAIGSFLSSHHTVIIGETLNWSLSGYSIVTSENISISDTYIENIQTYGIRISDSSSIQTNNVSMKSCEGGISIFRSNNISFKDISIEGPNSNIGINCWENSQDVVFERLKIDQSTQNAVKIADCEDIKIYNSEIDASNRIFNLVLSSVNLYNTSYNQSKVMLDSYSSISLNWFFDVQVRNWLDVPQDNADVQIRTVQGTLIYSGLTDINGRIGDMWLCEQTQYSVFKEIFIPYQIQAVFSNHSGFTTFMLNRSSETTVWLENDLPSASNVVLSPSYPDTTSDLTLSYQYSDPENDPEVGTIIMWYVNGLHNSSFDNLLVINNSYTNKGQTWYCNVTPSDGSSYGISMLSTPITIQNTPPEASNVTILESNPKSSDDLHVQYDYFDIDGDIEFQSLLRWYVDNGSGWIYSGVDSQKLNSGYTKKGEMWKCNITPSDGDDLGNSIESLFVAIGNSQPQVFDVTISPTAPESNRTLWAIYNYYDLDGDLESGTLIRWYKNDIMEEDLNDSTTVDSSKTQSGDNWYCIVTPRDGEDFGTSMQSNTVFIGNTPPGISNVNITPQSPDTSDDLIVGYDYYDEDGDLESDDTIIKWYRMRPGDLEFSYIGYQGRILSSSFTTKGESWKCVVIPHDGQHYGGNVNSTNFVSIYNSPPSVSNIVISPEEATTINDLVTNYDYFDKDGDIENGTKILWFCNDVHMSILDNSTTVSHDRTEKNQIWYFSVQPRDGNDLGGVYNSTPITIKNSPPEAINITITPETPLGEDDLRARYTFYDEDDDIESGSEIKWYKNGLLQAKYNDIFQVESSDTKKGEFWYFELIVSDGESYDEITSSHYVVIENSKPQLKSVLPVLNQLFINESESLEFQVDVVDPDGDLLYYKWKLGKTTLSDDDYFLLETDYQSAGSYVLNLTIQDIGENSGTLFHEWIIVVNNINLIPQIVILEPTSKNPKIKEGESLRFIIDESDPDSEIPPSITWILDGEVAQSGGSSYTYAADDLASGTHEVKAVVDDGIDSAEYAWDLSVQDIVSEEFLGLSYDAWGLIMAILSALGAILLFLFGFYRVRKKKGRLKEHMVEMDLILSREKDPGIIEDTLVELEDKINQEFSQGKLEDLHYHMLQDIIIAKRGEARKAEITSKFGRLPQRIINDLDEMLKDGKISQLEYQGFVATISKSESLSPAQKEELSKMIGEWEDEDKDATEGEPPEEKDESEEKPEKSEEDEEMEKEPDSSEDEKQNEE
jgi:parallel beta-helix repeat protein